MTIRCGRYDVIVVSNSYSDESCAYGGDGGVVGLEGSDEYIIPPFGGDDGGEGPRKERNIHLKIN